VTARNPENLQDLSTEETIQAKTVDLHYPEPTLLSIIVKDVAQWTELAFIMEPTVNSKIQIFAPRRLSQEEAYDLFLASLSVVGLRAVRKGSIVKIVQTQAQVTA
jgi:hypothetical protein